jgi:hypothetical protein
MFQRQYTDHGHLGLFDYALFHADERKYLKEKYGS